MARIRTIRPEFWTSVITECSVPARLLFLGLLNFADDGGRMPYAPKNIKGLIYPRDDFTSSDIERMIGELSSKALREPLVEVYEFGGRRYLEITSFSADQKVKFPTFLFPDRHGAIPETRRPKRVNVSGVLNSHAHMRTRARENKQ